MSLNANAALREFIKNLRTFECEQIKGQLGHPDFGYCAMGVACETYRGHHPLDSAWTRQGFVLWQKHKYCHAEPQEVLAWLGLTEEDGLRITEWNDAHSLTFEEIADKLEEMYLKEEHE